MSFASCIIGHLLFVRGSARMFMHAAAVLAVLFAGSVVPAAAQDIDPQLQLFSITGILVDERARDAVVAQQQGLQQAERIAFEAIIRKLTQSEDRSRVPALTNAQIQNFIFGIEIDNERRSQRRYRAEITVRFLPDALSDFLSEHGIPHVRSSGRSVTVVHAHSRGLETFLWDKDPVVRAAQQAQDVDNRIRVYHFPAASQRLDFRISVAAVTRLDSEVFVRASDLFPGEDILAVSSRWDGVSTLDAQFSFRGGPVVRSLTVTADTELAALSDMYARIFDDIDSIWRSTLLIGGGEATTLVFLADTRQAADFHRYRTTLERLPVVEDVTVEQLAVPLSRFSIRFKGTLDQLRLTLAAQGIRLHPYGDMHLLSQNKTGEDE